MGHWIVYDSLNSSTYAKAVGPSLLLIQPSCGKARIELGTIKMQKQTGSVDCGLFAIACALELAKGNDPVHIQFSQTLMRKHYDNCMGNDFLESFPQLPSTEPIDYNLIRFNRKSLQTIIDKSKETLLKLKIINKTDSSGQVISLL